MNPPTASHNSSAQYPAPPPYYQPPSHQTHHRGPQTAAGPTNRAVPKPRTTFLEDLEELDRSLKAYVPAIFQSVVIFVFIGFFTLLMVGAAVVIFCFVILALEGGMG
ncbi:hypothetical protein VE00_02654 [Pseudogymnoascus sp. WSF 3629]|nr:hypothetical protein VE00_02654 [Pseudogymnoascus sp. WSF 3629]